MEIGGATNIVIEDADGNEINPATEVTVVDLLMYQKRVESILLSLLKEQEKTNRMLRKIYNPE